MKKETIKSIKKAKVIKEEIKIDAPIEEVIEAIEEVKVKPARQIFGISKIGIVKIEDVVINGIAKKKVYLINGTTEFVSEKELDIRLSEAKN
jgi:hypothetical protein